MMEHLPPVGWADVATKRDLDHMAEVFDLRLTAEVTGLKGEMAQLRTELRGEFAAGMNVLDNASPIGSRRCGPSSGCSRSSWSPAS